MIPKAWRTYTVKNTNGGLPNDWVYAIAIDKKGVSGLAQKAALPFMTALNGRIGIIKTD